MRATVDQREVLSRLLELDVPLHLGRKEQILQELFEEGEEGVVGEEAVDPLGDGNAQFSLGLLLEFDGLLAAAAVGPVLQRLYCSWGFFHHCEVFQLHADRIHPLLGVDQGEDLLAEGTARRGFGVGGGLEGEDEAAETVLADVDEFQALLLCLPTRVEADGGSGGEDQFGSVFQHLRTALVGEECAALHALLRVCVRQLVVSEPVDCKLAYECAGLRRWEFVGRRLYLPDGVGEHALEGADVLDDVGDVLLVAAQEMAMFAHVGVEFVLQFAGLAFVEHPHALLLLVEAAVVGLVLDFGDVEHRSQRTHCHAFQFPFHFGAFDDTAGRAAQSTSAVNHWSLSRWASLASSWRVLISRLTGTVQTGESEESNCSDLASAALPCPHSPDSSLRSALLSVFALSFLIVFAFVCRCFLPSFLTMMKGSSLSTSISTLFGSSSRQSSGGEAEEGRSSSRRRCLVGVARGSGATEGCVRSNSQSGARLGSQQLQRLASVSSIPQRLPSSSGCLFRRRTGRLSPTGGDSWAVQSEPSSRFSLRSLFYLNLRKALRDFFQGMEAVGRVGGDGVSPNRFRESGGCLPATCGMIIWLSEAIQYNQYSIDISQWGGPKQRRRRRERGQRQGETPADSTVEVGSGHRGSLEDGVLAMSGDYN